MIADFRLKAKHPVHRPGRAVFACLIATIFFLSLSGCGRLGFGIRKDDAVVQRLSQTRYPLEAELGDDLDIVVVREGAAVQFVNRTALGFEKPQVWLNREYVADLDAVHIGTENWVDLVHFINRHGESFPVGALLAPDKSRPVVAADLFDPATGKVHRLTVRPAES